MLNKRRFDFIIYALFAWEIFARWIYPGFEPQAAIFLPPFSSVIKELGALFSSGLLWRHISASGQRIIIGFSLASFCGISAGVILGLSERTYEQLQGICRFLMPIPPVAWIPISLLWLGITEAQQCFIVFIGTVFPILFNTLQGVHEVSSRHIDAARALGAGRFLILRKVILPSAFPKIMFGLRSGIGYGWFIIVAAEFVSAPSGLGYLILEGRNMIITERIFVGMAVIGTLNLLGDGLLTKIERRTAPWNTSNIEEQVA